jgi:dTDP-4-amino-4,6-dideoxygalactose transaminase
MKEIKLSKSIIGQEEIDAVADVLKRGYLGMGADVDLFEKKLSAFFKTGVTCVNTGTAALHLALQAIGLGPGDEVLVQSLTYVSTFQAISATGATPIACEVYNNTLTIDLDDAKKKLTSKTKAILPVHYAGNAGDLDAIYSFAKTYNLRVIEDASHAFGTVYKDKLIGSFGDICCISLDGIKNITSGEGGIIITNDEVVNQRVKDARLLGVEKDTDNRYKGLRSWDFDVKFQGWRYHMSNIMAAIGIVQFEKFPVFKNKRQYLATIYQNELKGYVELIDCDYSLVVPHIFVIRADKDKRDIIRNELNKIGVPTGIHYKPNHLLSYYAGNQDNITLSNTNFIYDRLITLPLHPEITHEEAIYICNKVKEWA